MQGEIDEHDNFGSAHAIAQQRFVRLAKTPFSTASLGIMNPTDYVAALRDDALRKIGRNVVNFQKVEGCLKVLVAISNIQGTPADLEPRQLKNGVRLRRIPMGELAQSFHRNVYGDGPKSDAPEDLSALWISASLKLEADPKTVKARKQALSKLVSERNKLIHQELASFDHNSAENCRRLINVLDDQNTRILDELEQMKSIFAMVKEFAGDLRTWVESDDFLNHVQGSNSDA